MKKILYIINVDWFFISHFLPVAIEAKKRGLEVHIACGLTDRLEFLEQKGFTVHPLSISRSGTGIIKELVSIVEIFNVIRLVNPDIVEFLTIKPILYGGIISRLLPSRKKVFYITGLGYVFTRNGVKGLIVRNIVKIFYRMALSAKNTTVITENIFDKNLINSLNVLKSKNIKIIKGAGVDLKQYTYTEEDTNEVTIIMASRLLRDKGVFEYIKAAKVLKDRGLNATFELYGDVDEGNPTSISFQELEHIREEGYVSVHGFTSSIAQVFSKSNIIVLPSYREGFPKVLVEAAACGRAIVTTDVPGCRDAITVNKSGLLCKVKDVHSLAQQIEKLVLDQKLRMEMGKSGRSLAEKEFDIRKITQEHFITYEDNYV